MYTQNPVSNQLNIWVQAVFCQWKAPQRFNDTISVNVVFFLELKDDHVRGKALASVLQMPLWTSNMLDGTLHQSSPGWKLKKLGCKSYTELKLPTCWMQRAGQRVDDDLRMIDDSYCQPYQVFYCHCTTCRVQTGALAVLFGAFPRSLVIESFTHK